MRLRAAETKVLDLKAWAWAGSGCRKSSRWRARAREISTLQDPSTGVVEGGARGGQRDAGGASGEERRRWRGRRQGGRGNDKALESGVVLVLVVVEEIGPGAAATVKGGRAVVSAQRHHDGLRARSGEGLDESLTQLGQRDRQLGSIRFA